MNQRPGTHLDALRSAVAAESSDGRRVAQSPCDNAVCTMKFNATTHCIEVVWKMYATSLQLRFIHECLLDLIRTYHATRVLGDDTALGIIHADDQAWIADSWLPRAIAAGITAGASKAPATYFAEQAVRRIQASAPSGISLGSFRDLSDARAWLLSSGSRS
jgi:hypothetical protein